MSFQSTLYLTWKMSSSTKTLWRRMDSNWSTPLRTKFSGSSSSVGFYGLGRDSRQSSIFRGDVGFSSRSFHYGEARRIESSSFSSSKTNPKNSFPHFPVFHFSSTSRSAAKSTSSDNRNDESENEPRRSHNGDDAATPAQPEIKKENIATIPNMLTASRMALSPVIGYLVVNQAYAPAMILFGIAGFTDLLDGYIARNVPNQSSTLGMAIDPLADKLLMTVMTLSLTWANLFPTTLAVLIITRDVLLIASGFALRYFSLSPPITLKRYFDISLPSAEVYPTFSSKLNTMVQLLAVAASLAAPLWSLTDSPLLKALWFGAGATTVWSGASYAINGASCFKILAEEKGGQSGEKKRGVSMKEIQMMGGVGFSLGLAFVCWKTF